MEKNKINLFLMPLVLISLGINSWGYKEARSHSLEATLNQGSNPRIINGIGDSFLITQSVNLTDRWRGDDGGTYFLRQVDNELWWYGESANSGRSWTNVFKGRIRGNRIDGTWADVPRGRVRGSGSMSLLIVSPTEIRAIRKTGGFSGSNWTRLGMVGEIPDSQEFPRFLGTSNRSYAQARSEALNKARQHLGGPYLGNDPLNYKEVTRGKELRGRTFINWVVIQLERTPYTLDITQPECPHQAEVCGIIQPLPSPCYFRDPRQCSSR